MNSILFLIALGITIWFWQDTLRAREVAVSRSRNYCKEMHLQFLDESVALMSLKPGRGLSGNFAFHRYYHFEFSLDGHNRFSGTTYLIGHYVQSIQLDHPDGIIIEQEKV
ncbi:MAG: DUF3301 domain-containing protein [Proteobacteria bacterium]|nr:DUF3301 domain-containing protein [Pseudomonadota bacterium]